MERVSPQLKEYHRTHNIPTVQRYTAARLRSLAEDIEAGKVDNDQLEYILGHLSQISYRKFGRQFLDLWGWLRSLKTALRD